MRLFNIIIIIIKSYQSKVSGSISIFFLHMEYQRQTENLNTTCQVANDAFQKSFSTSGPAHGKGQRRSEGGSNIAQSKTCIVFQPNRSGEWKHKNK